MRKFNLLVLNIIVFVLYAGAQQPATVKGTVLNGWKDGDIIDISEMTGNAGITTETTVKDGKFEYSLLLTEPMLINAYNRNGMGGFSLMLSPGDQVTVVYGNNKIDIKGATLQADFEKNILQPFAEQNQRRTDLWKQYQEAILAANPKDGKEPEVTEEYKVYLQKAAELDETFKQEMDEWLLQHASTIWAPMAILYNPTCKPSEELYAAFAPEVKASIYGKQIRQKLDAVLTGKSAPDFTLKDAAGKEHSLEELLEGHQYLLVDFWASWCAPCRKGIPEMKEFAKKYADKGLVVLSISVDKDRDAWLKALEEEQMPWTNLWDDAGIKVKYGVKGIPSVFLLKADGTVLFEKLYGEAIGRELKKALGE